MSFLAYVLRTATEDIRKHAETMAEASIRLLRDCPPEAVASRKELLVATRHILSTDFRAMFVSQIDIMLDERVLVGTGITSQEALRPLAYSMLADLVHHVRNELTVAQLTRVVHIYSCCLHEPAFTFGIQTMCAKLLLNLIETICSKTDKVEAPKFLMAILECCIDKLGAIDTIHEQLKGVYGKEAVERRREKGKARAAAATETKDDVKVEKKADKKGAEKGKVEEQVKKVDKEDLEDDDDQPAWLTIERAKPVHSVSFASDGSDAAYSKGSSSHAYIPAAFPTGLGH